MKINQYLDYPILRFYTQTLTWSDIDVSLLARIVEKEFDSPKFFDILILFKIATKELID